MENKEQDFINRYKDVQESIVKAIDKALERAIGNKVKLRHKFRSQILEYWGEDTGILIGTTMVYERHLWNEEVKVI